MFEINQYDNIIQDLIHDINYSNSSYRNKISKIRQYSEMIIRKILNLSPSSKVTLGDKIIEKKIKIQSNYDKILLDSLETIKNFGNDCTHTQINNKITEKNLGLVTDALFELYAYLFRDYFSKYKFGSNPEIVKDFSLLPPIIRYKVLKQLYENDKTNITIIDHFTLAILKSKGKSEAYNWINERKEELENLSAISKEILESYPSELLPFIDLEKNMYQCCCEKIEDVGTFIEENGKIYDTFEEILQKYHYISETPIYEYKAEKEFYLIMEFVYKGRKAKIE